MKNSIKTELAQHILDRINDGILTTENREDWHFLCFNEDYYIIGYYQASQWLKKHNIGEFEAAGICQQYEIDNFGESKVYDNSEMTVNMLAYIYGEEVLNSFTAEALTELEEEVKEIC
jgi:thermostable 8-oxoguanine DNA glycosylase